MKKIIIFIAAMILVFPCILIFNESDSVWVNLMCLIFQRYKFKSKSQLHLKNP